MFPGAGERFSKTYFVAKLPKVANSPPSEAVPGLLTAICAVQNLPQVDKSRPPFPLLITHRRKGGVNVFICSLWGGLNICMNYLGF